MCGGSGVWEEMSRLFGPNFFATDRRTETQKENESESFVCILALAIQHDLSVVGTVVVEECAKISDFFISQGGAKQARSQFLGNYL